MRAVVGANSATEQLSIRASMPLVPLADTERTHLRFAVGARVVCMTSDGWQPGTIKLHWYNQSGFPDGMRAPYQVVLDNRRLIYVPNDDDRCVRTTTIPSPEEEFQMARPKLGGPYPVTRFGIGARVTCQTPGGWKCGMVEELFWDADPRIPRDKCAPYQVLLDGDEGTLIFVPEDTDRSIRACVEPRPDRSGPIRDRGAARPLERRLQGAAQAAGRRADRGGERDGQGAARAQGGAGGRLRGRAERPAQPHPRARVERALTSDVGAPWPCVPTPVARPTPRKICPTGVTDPRESAE